MKKILVAVLATLGGIAVAGLLHERFIVNPKP